MCERRCPRCGSTDHVEQFGISGLYIACTRCGAILACRRDIEAAPIDMTETQAEAWRREGWGVLPGAEAVDPADDQLFTPPEAQKTSAITAY